MSDRRVEYMPLEEIARAPRNAKLHDVDAIERSISHYGLADLPVLDDRTGRLVSGHGRLDDLTARYAAGQDPPDGIRVDKKTKAWLVPVNRGWASRSDKDAEAYLLMANQSTILGGWDETMLGPVLSDLAEADLLALTGFTDEDLAALLAEDDGGDMPGGGDPDSTPDVPVHAVSTIGDVWILGDRHRVLCGDATNPDHLDLVLKGPGDPGIVYTDPPYGISIVKEDGEVGVSGPFGGRRAGRVGVSVSANVYLPVAGDDTTDTARDSFRLLMAAYPHARHVWWGGNHYAASAGLPDASCWLIWDKENDGNTFADGELAWTDHKGPVRIFRHMWQGMVRASERGRRLHPTQKPVALAEWAFGVVDPGNTRTVVLDVFGGSGSTLLAAHRTGRTAAVIELEPAYVDVIARRFQEATGTAPILESTGQPHDFTTETANA